MEEVFERTMFLEINNYRKHYKECLIQAIKELIPEYYLKDLYSIFGITYNDYLEDMSNAYLRYRDSVCQN